MSQPQVHDLVTIFKSMPHQARIQTLDQLVESCDAVELRHLELTLPNLLFRDFVKFLPPEVAYRVLSYLDCESLFLASRVSRIWNHRISSFQNLWKSKAINLGIRLQENLQFPGLVWKSATMFGLQFRRRLSSGEAFCDEVCAMPNYNFGAVSYDRGQLLYAISREPPNLIENPIVGDHRLVLWCPATRTALRTFLTSARPSAVKLANSEAACAAHFDGKATSFDLRETETGLKFFRAHSASILSVDMSMRLGIFATGSADKSVKIWKLFSDQLIKSLNSFTHWVVSIILKDSSQHGLTRFEGKNILLTMTRDEVALFSWHDDQSSTQTDELRNVTVPNFVIPLKCNDGWSLRDVFFTPGLILTGQVIAFVKQMPMFDTLTIGDAEILLADANTGRIDRVYHMSHKIRKLLAIGSRFALILLPYVDPTFKNLIVLDLKDSKICGGYTIPHSRATTPDFSQISVCETGWLDGISESIADINEPVLAMASVPDFNLHIVRWNFAQTD